VVEIGGPGRLRLVHANDSMDVRGAFRDRHQKLGEGHIGTQAFAELLAHPATAGVPFILETPGSRDVEDGQIRLLKKLRVA
jgi:deoxyribonuclease-4